MDYIQFFFPTLRRNFIGCHDTNIVYPRFTYFILPIIPIYFNNCFISRRRNNIDNDNDSDSQHVNSAYCVSRSEEPVENRDDVITEGNIRRDILDTFEPVDDTTEEMYQEFIVGNPNTMQFKLIEILAHGTFSQVHLGINLSNGKKVAVKLESRDSRDKLLLKEYKVYKILRDGTGINRIRWFGINGEFSVLVMDLLGPDLFTLFTTEHEFFSLTNVLLLARQMIDIIEFVHSRKVIHRDIKPENFALGLGYKQAKLFLIDFGLAEEFIDRNTGNHVPCSENNGFTGTLLYSSINALMGRRQSRRDDLESIGYLLIFFIKKSLPWQFLDANVLNPITKTLHLRMCTSLGSLCYGLPHEFIRYLIYCRNLEFEETPDYMFLRYLFRILLDKFEAIDENNFK